MQQSHPNQIVKDDHAEDNPAFSMIIEQNIRTMTRLSLKAAEERSFPNHLADNITAFSGSMLFVYIHVFWFGTWFLLNTGRVGIRPFDPFPYGLLTMIVSLEAIFLATFVLLSQNRLSEESGHRADLALHIGLLTEHELTTVLHMLDDIQDKMGIENDEERELIDLEKETRPEDVLAEIVRVQQSAVR